MIESVNLFFYWSMTRHLARMLSEEVFVYMDKEFEELKDLFITNSKYEFMSEIKSEMKTFISIMNDKIGKLDSTLVFSRLMWTSWSSKRWVDVKIWL